MQLKKKNIVVNATGDEKGSKKRWYLARNLFNKIRCWLKLSRQIWECYESLYILNEMHR